MKRKSGIILGISLIIFLVISIIGAALITIVMGRAKQTNDLEKRTQAYFFAKSGVEIAREYFENTNLQNKIHVIYGDLSNEDENGDISLSVSKEDNTGDWKSNIREKLEEFRIQQGKEITVAVWKDSEKTRILSTGCAGDFSRVITFELMLAGNSGGGVPVFDMAIFANDTVSIGSSQTIEGNVGTNATDTSAIRSQGGGNKDLKIDGEVFFGPGTDLEGIDPKEYTKDGTVSALEDPRDYEAMLPKFPDFSESSNLREELIDRGTLKVLESSKSINEDGYYETIEVKGKNKKEAKLIIDTGSEGDVRKIVVDKLEINSDASIELSGEGKLNLYVNSISGSASINVLGDKKEIDRVVVYYSGNSLKNVDLDLVGTLFIDSASDIALGQGNNELKVSGLIIYGGNGEVSMKGTPQVSTTALFAPKATVIMSGTADFYGAIVCNKYLANGNPGVIYRNAGEVFSETSLEIIAGDGDEAYELWGE